MQALHIPSHIVPAANDGPGEINGGIVRDDPINVTVLGNQLEELHEKRHFLEFDGDTCKETLRRPVNVLEVNIAFFLRKTDQAIGFQGGIENPALSVDIFQTGDTGVP